MLLFCVFIIVWFLLLMRLSNDGEFDIKAVIWVLASILVYWGFSYINAPDMKGYMLFFNKISTHGWVLNSLRGTSGGNMEPGLFIIMQLCKRLNSSFFFFQAIMLSINVILAYFGLRKIYGLTKDALVFIILFAVNITFFMSAMRQGVVISLFIFCIPLFVENKWKYYIPILILSIFFHQTAFLLILVPLIWYLYNKISSSHFLSWSWFKITVFIVCNLSYFAGLSIGEFIESRLANIVFDSSVSTTRSLSVGHSMEESNFGILKVLELDLCYAIFCMSNLVEKNNYFKLIGGLVFVFFCMNMLVGGIIVHRISYYIQIPYYIALFASLNLLLTKYLHFDDKLSNGIIYCYMVFLYLFQAVSSSGYIFEYHLLDLL